MTRPPRHPLTVRLVRLLAAVAGALSLGLAPGPVLAPAASASSASPASSAHGGAGVLEVQAAHPLDAGVHYIVQLTYRNDGDPVSGAEVTATPVDPDGQEQAPVTLQPSNDGIYQGPIDMPDPGRWTVRFAADDPEAALEQTVEISATTTESSGGSTGGSSEGFAPADDGTGASAAADDDGGSGSLPILLIVAAAVIAIGGLVTALRIVLRTRPTPPASATPDSAGTAPPPTGPAATPTGPTGPTSPDAEGSDRPEPETRDTHPLASGPGADTGAEPEPETGDPDPLASGPGASTGAEPEPETETRDTHPLASGPGASTGAEPEPGTEGEARAETRGDGS